MTVRLTPDPATTRPEPHPVMVAVAIGSNLGDREAQIASAIHRLGATVQQLRVSTILETAPVGVPDAQRDYLNAVAVGVTTLEPRALLEELFAIERDCGRTRNFQNAARTLDLDLILYGDRVIDEPGLVVPHPRYRERAFVLQPLVELAADWRDPVTSRTMAELLARLPPAPPANRP